MQKAITCTDCESHEYEPEAENLDLKCTFCGLQLNSARDLRDHMLHCDQTPVHCKYADHGCDVVLPVAELLRHIRTCTYVSLTCSCGHPSLYGHSCSDVLAAKLQEVARTSTDPAVAVLAGRIDEIQVAP